jgi:serine/threonine-protein kinase
VKYAADDRGLHTAATAGGLGTQQVVALVAGGVGVVGVGVGSWFGLRAMSRRDHARDICPADCDDDAGRDAWRDAVSAGNLSTAGFVVGGTALAAAAVLWLTAPVGNLRVGLGHLGWEGAL